MLLAGLDVALLDGAVWGLAAAVLLAAAGAHLPERARHAFPRALAAVACVAAAALGARLLAGATVAPLEWWPGLPGEPFTLAPDALAGPFLLLFGLAGTGAFAAHAPAGSRAGAQARLALHALFALALLVVFATRHALLFLAAWELMTLASAALVAGDLASARARSATWVYVALSHAGAALVAAGLVTLSAHAGSYRFEALAAAWPALPPATATALAWLFTLGFAVKLGLVPAHVWLPMAHPEAPGPVSAMMSGVMVNAGLYGMLRFAWQLPGAPPAHWGTALMLAGLVSALAGALYATVEADAKRLLAWSTIKNTGLMAMSLGLAATLAAAGRPEIAGLALAAVLVHAIGHGLAKAAAFLAVAEAAHAAGSRNLEALGGLARRMPRVALAALASTLALCALPPFSCFPGEWLTFQALILGYSSGAGPLRLLTPFVGAGLALATALAVASLVKLHGIAFLGRPRSEGAANAHDATGAVGATLLAMAALPLLAGLASPWLARALGGALAALLPRFDATALEHLAGLALAPGAGASDSVSPALVTAVAAAAAIAAWGALRAVRRGRAGVRLAPSWSCGAPLDARMQYSALGFTKPLRLVFEPVLRAERELEVLEEGSPYFGRRMRYRSGVPAFFENFLYQPFVQGVLWSSERLRRLQAGSLHIYLAYLLATLVGLLLWAR